MNAGADEPPRRQGHQMADADYDGFDGGLSQGRDDARLTGTLTGASVQRYVNLAGGLVSLALVVGLGVWGYKLAVRDVNGVPVIQAMEGPMRIAPVDPGGEVADHQGLAVNDVAAVGIAAPPPERLVLAPRPVELSEEDVAGLAGSAPLDTELAAMAAPVAGAADLALAAAPPTESISPTEVAVDAALAEALGEAPAAEPGAEAAVEPVLDLAQVPEGAVVVSPRPMARPVARAEAPLREAEATVAAEEIDPSTIAVGTRLVQFGTFGTTEEARAEWARIERQFGDVMVGKAMVIQSAERSGTTFYRLRALGFEDEADARRFCSVFVSQSATCIPVPHK
jgi:hypothetical protein